MNWKTYETLTKEQREEWSFRFGHIKKRVVTKGLVLSISLFVSMLMSLLMSAYFLFKEPVLENHIETIGLIISSVGNVAVLMIWMVVIQVVWDAVSYTIAKVQEKRFLKKHSIKYIYDWPLNLISNQRVDK